MKRRVAILVALAAFLFNLPYFFFHLDSNSNITTISSNALAATANENITMSSDTQFIDIDLAYVILDPTFADRGDASPIALSRGVEPSPFILWRNDITHENGVWIMTLNSASGAQMGNRLHVDFLKSWYPVAGFWGRHFGNSSPKGVEPSPFIIFRDFRIQTFQVSYAFDGTPSASAPVTYTPVVDSIAYGHAMCAAELPGSEFTDGTGRLFIGTDLGHIVVLSSMTGGAVIVEEILPVSSGPLTKLKPIPQCNYIAIGVLDGGVIRGIHYQPGAADSGGKAYSQIFALTDPRPDLPTDFAMLGADDSLPSDCQVPLRLILANGTLELGRANTSYHDSGIVPLNVTPEPHSIEIKSIAAQPLLMLTADGSSVLFDPHYSELNGSSGCDLNIGDEIADECSYLCGDANGDQSVNVSDAVYIINYVFVGGVAPNPLATADANCDSSVNVSDAVYIINYIFIGGNYPCDTNGDGTPDC